VNAQNRVVGSGFVAPQFVTPQFVQTYPGHGAFAAVTKRDGDVAFADNHHQVNTQATEWVPAFAPVAWSQQVPQPVAFVQPVARPLVVPAPAQVVAPIVAEQDQQKATIIQNKA
ncbi:hypothetical protein EV180_007481, partial [Coemansia sp. RSA 518]